MIKKTILSILIIFCSNTVLEAAILEKTNDTLFFDTESIPIKMYSNHKDGYLHFICENVDDDDIISWWMYNPYEIDGDQPRKVKEFSEDVESRRLFFFTEDNQPRLGVNYGPYDSYNSLNDSSVFRVYNLSNQEFVREEIQDRTTYLSHYETKDKIVKFKSVGRFRVLSVNNKEKDSTIFNQKLSKDGEHLFFDYNNDGIDELAVWEYYDSIQVFSFAEKNVEKIMTIDIADLVWHSGSYFDFSAFENSLNIFKDNDTLYKIKIHNNRTYDIDTLNFRNNENRSLYPIKGVIYLDKSRSLMIEGRSIYITDGLDVLESHVIENSAFKLFKNENIIYSKLKQQYNSKGHPEKVTLLTYNLIDKPIVDYRLINQTNKLFITEDLFYFKESYYSLHNKEIEKTWQPLDFIIKYSFNNGISNEVIISEDNLVRYNPQELLFPFRGEVNSDGRIAIPGTYYYYWYDFTNDSTNFNESWIRKGLAGILSSGFNENDYYSIGIRDTFNNVIYLNLQKEDELDTLIQTNSIITNTKFYDFNETEYSGYALTEGLENDINSQLYNFRIVGSEIESIDVIELDGTASGQDLNTNNTKIAIVLDEKNEINIINLANSLIEKTIDLKPFFSGKPKDVAFDNGMLYVTTNNNQVLIINETSGELEDRILVDGSSKDIVKNGNILAVVNDKHPDGTLSNRILFFDLLKTSVDQDISKVTAPPIRIYPHPVANDFHMVSDELVGELSIVIIDGQGKIVATHSAVADGEVEMSADELGLGAGNYTAIINGTKAVRFIVIK